ncbi:MAG: ribosome-associated translation inhibitor RaiA [Actinomycetaceae bacterium]|nr:ribosome-associated translation inhibitor RaiA [Actinomycetaceae bacterium]
MDIAIAARNAEIHSNFRDHVEEKLAKVEQLAPRAQRVDVELTHERNPRQADNAERIELTVRGKGPVIRAEASSSDRYAALDLAAAKLFERLRRARDRVKDHRRYDIPDPEALEIPITQVIPEGETPAKTPLQPGEAREEQLGDSPVIVREKMHETNPMGVDDALYEMELVGHPFYVFIDKETMEPCVVYHRHGWTYGVIRLNAKCEVK